MSPDENFRKREHILKTREFRRIYNSARKYQKSGIALLSTKNNVNTTRLGLVVGARNIKNATRRNRIKRILREYFRRNKKYFKDEIDILFVIKNLPSKNISYSSVEPIVKSLIKEAGITR